MPGFDGNVLFVNNIDFTDNLNTHFNHPGNFTALGDLAIGTGVAPPGQQISVGHITGSGGIVISYPAGNINVDGSGAGTATTYNEDAGSATPAANILRIVGAGTVTTAGAGNTITITGTASGGITWTNIAASQTLAVNNGYFCNAGGTLALALPAVSAIGDTIEIVLIGSTGFTVTQAAGQQIVMGNQQTTAGVGGSLANTGQGDALTMVCQTANLIWVIRNMMGNVTFV
jgi:hypothetical protein